MPVIVNVEFQVLTDQTREEPDYGGEICFMANDPELLERIKEVLRDELGHLIAEETKP